MTTNLDVIIGRKIEGSTAKAIIRLPWENNIGAFIVGRPGSGKSHVIASLLTQYAIKEVSIAIAEYNADPDNKDSLIYRAKHIRHLLAYPEATTGKEVEKLMLWLQDELSQRQTGKKVRTPLIVVLDEFFAFSNTYKPPIGTNRKKTGDARSDEGETTYVQKEPSYWEILVSILSDLRKNNIRILMALQEPASSSGSLMRQARDMFRFKLVMNLGYGSSKLVGITDLPSQRIVNSLPPGFILLRDVEDIVIGVPYPINPRWIELAVELEAIIKPARATITQEKEYVWTDKDTDLYLDALFRYWNKFDTVDINGNKLPTRIDTKEDLIRFLVVLGWSQNKVEKTIIGDNHRTRELYKLYKAQYFPD